MSRHLLTLILCAGCIVVQAQYKNDNVLYKTVYPQDFCKELEKTPGYVLLDVRSEGEFRDTSTSYGLNIGHLDGALNQYRNFIKPVFFQCFRCLRCFTTKKVRTAVSNQVLPGMWKNHEILKSWHGFLSST